MKAALPLVDVLSPGGTLLHSLQGAPELLSLELSCGSGNGPRYAGTLTLADPKGLFHPGSDRLPHDALLRLRLQQPNGAVLPLALCRPVAVQHTLSSNTRTARITLRDKWADLDGTLGGTLQGAHVVPAGSEIFTTLRALLRLGRYDALPNSPYPIDPLPPLFTTWYQGRSQLLPGGSTVPLTILPHDLVLEGGRTLGDVVLALADVLSARVGYDPCGRLTLQPGDQALPPARLPLRRRFTAQDPDLFSFAPLADLAGTVNEVIVLGGETDGVPALGLARNTDPADAGCIGRVGLHSRVLECPGLYSNDQCQSYAKRTLELERGAGRSLLLRCAPIAALQPGDLVALQRPDLPDTPEQRLQVQGYTLHLNPGRSEMELKTAILTT